jgi:hypothetical protein
MRTSSRSQVRLTESDLDAIAERVCQRLEPHIQTIIFDSLLWILIHQLYISLKDPVESQLAWPVASIRMAARRTPR